jgi:hypothetical protein
VSGDTVARLRAALDVTDPHQALCRAELDRPGTDVVENRLEAAAALETMRLRIEQAAGSGELPPPDLTALSAATGRLGHVMVFGRDHDCQALIDGADVVVFCWAVPVTRPHLPVTTR